MKLKLKTETVTFEDNRIEAQDNSQEKEYLRRPGCASNVNKKRSIASVDGGELRHIAFRRIQVFLGFKCLF